MIANHAKGKEGGRPRELDVRFLLLLVEFRLVEWRKGESKVIRDPTRPSVSSKEEEEKEKREKGEGESRRVMMARGKEGKQQAESAHLFQSSFPRAI